MATTLNTPASDVYLELVRAFPLRPIRTQRDHQRAIKTMLAVDAGHPNPTQAVNDYIEVLADLIERYEQEAGLKADLSHITPGQAVRHLMDSAGLSVTSLSNELGVNQGNLSEMLAGNRDFSKAAIVALSERFNVSPMLFLKSAV